MKQLMSQRSKRQTWPIKALTAAVTIAITSLVPANSATVTSDRKPIGDLEIYKAAKPGTASIFMMLDTSGSMGGNSGCRNYNSNTGDIRLVVYQRKLDASKPDGLFRNDEGNTVIDKNAPLLKNVNITFPTCKDGSGNTIARTLMARLQVALIELLSDEVLESGSVKDTGSLPDDYAVGMGNYSYDGDGRSGVVLVPTAELTAGQRVKLIEKIIDLRAEGNTPTAHAFAEAGAYMMGTNTYSYTYRNYSGFDDSVSTSKKDNSYISPLSDKECSGNGIYLLTDGQPNGSSTSRATSLMNTSLSGSSPALSINSCTNLQGDSSGRSWGCMASYAALLRNNASNSKGLPIKTATVGFGSAFAGLTGTRSITVNGEVKAVVDCDSGNVNDDTRNLCKLGEQKGDGEVKTYGDGGFYYTENSEEIAASIVDFSASLVQIINTAPSGTITIPEDPYRAANQLPYAYLPMLDPDIVSTASIWKGNLKKYNLDQGTLFGRGSNKLYKDIAGNLDENTQDEWQTANFVVEGKAANNNIAAGGVYAQLQAPSAGLGSVRTLYVEDYTTATDKTPMLRKVGVDSSGKPFGFDKLKDTVAYSQLNQRRLLSFLGFGGVLTNDGQPTTPLTTETNNLSLTKPTNEVKLLGGVVHSKPEAVSYGSKLDDKGSIVDPREDYLLFGSMDGALHLVDAKAGKEEFAIIPREMLINQPEALVENSKKEISKIGQPYFGVDAPWLVKTDYAYDLPGGKVTVDQASGKGMFAYGGLRMGGDSFYGMNITKRSEPKMLFTITPQGVSSATSGMSSTTGFNRLGRIWSKPIAAKIRLTKGSDSKKNSAPTDVLIFGGGYDMQYEVDGYVPTTSTPAKGNAIYMINAKTGKLIWSTSSEDTSGVNVKTDTMINSITGGIAVLDRDNDGLMDHLYAADLGGQVFRADFENARIAQFGFTAVNSFSNKGVTRILDVAPTDKKLAYRFYESPVVSFYRREKGPDTGKLFAMVNVISGNRSAPLSTLRNNNEYANRVYGIIDNDVTNKDLYNSGFTKTIANLTEAKLVNLGSAIPTIGSATTDIARESKKNDAIKSMIGVAKSGTTPAAPATKNGWYYPLTRFDGYSNVRYNKGVGESTVINNLLYTTVYNPDKVYGNTASCSAKIMGGSERQLYCLPYGVCMDETSITGTGGFTPAGQGIQELAIGAYNADNTDIKVLIGTTTIADRIDAAKRAKYGTDGFKDSSNIKDLYPGENNSATQNNGDGSAVEFLFNERYTLQPKAWYERKKQ
ncbi:MULTISPECIES: pilus assembly protein PilY [unclassified Psychrobacter]|uniref:pilus assembly protein PilY n=1 Tax=unclassified Psychrobacter TaxID=196806 RepID=UPI000C348238|nr:MULTISPECIES: pilus assembly protein PilY [unclassified Psychrobacter]MBA6244036.1 pilus assembly protein PilY [Psychrobacter sp. Urea-trap-18]MBA6287252.1 pilus assembly protein PilY [Psychrobacter sp. Urea-trap-16]MBA6318366.1 pilus assembly protein PilY [Psychrobacter sp. Urea-trap-20]MBA6335310.1 pilus assembly protein PilY [Psychrobacter sp. Urea-trap-19]PKG60306.1 pilus assembly protein PilY [Psychrobacter sp. Choline-3u-12]